MVNKTEQLSTKDSALGVWYAIAAFATWGFLPLYWKTLLQVPAGELLAHHVLWSFILVFMIIVINGNWTEFRNVVSSTNLRIVFLGALLISINWFLYILAINTNQVVEASLGYYINPLINVFLGVLVLKERLNFWQLVALVLAIAGVVIITSRFGRIPWIALTLAFTFALYSLVKKLINLSSLYGLTLETAFVVPVALIYLSAIQFKGTGALGTGALGTVSLGITLMLICSGIVTAMPLLLFASGAKRVSLSTVGFIQYLSPTITLIIGVFIFKETFTRAHFLSFGFIWVALLLYTLSGTNMLYNFQPAYFKKYFSNG